VRKFISSPKFVTITIALLALIFIPLTLIEVQSQQTSKQHADTIEWYADESASSACATDNSGAIISATFTNSESPSSSTAMNVVATDQQTGKSVNMGSIAGGQTKTSTIATGKDSLNAGTVTFGLTWTDGHSGTDSFTATYKAVYDCIVTPTPTPTPTPTVPPGIPTPTICPTLGPVQDIQIVCPNCQLTPTPSPVPSITPTPTSSSYYSP
jgi:hypothetical protein